MEPAGRHRSSVWAQLVAMVRRNILIKKRQKVRTLMEILMPILLICQLAISPGKKSKPHDAVTAPHGAAAVTDVPPLLRMLQIVLHVAPNTTKAQREFGNRLAAMLNVSVVFHADEVAMDHLGRKPPKGEWVAGLVLPEQPGTRDLNYTLRMDSRGNLPVTNLVSDDACRNSTPDGGLELGCPANSYFHSGFLLLQNAVDALMIQLKTHQNVSVMADVIIQNGPRPEVKEGDATAVIQQVTLDMIMSCAIVLPTLLTLIVGEKEAKIKDGLKLMGLRDSVYWLAWFLVYALLFLSVCSVSCVIIYLSKVFKLSNYIYFFIFFLLFGLSLVTFGFMLTPFFTKVKVAGGVGTLALVVFFAVTFLPVFTQNSVPTSSIMLMSLFSPIAFVYGVEKAMKLDIEKNGLVTATLWDAEDMGVSFGGCIIMVLIDFFLYAFIAFYLDNVLPNECGRRESIFFIFKPSYWLRSNKSMKLLGGEVQDATNPDIEPVSPELRNKAALRVSSLRKVFKVGGKKLVATDDLSLVAYEGQITAILGHNGAGKSTFFNILTGLIMPTSGTATVYGLDITDPRDMRELWSIIGLCPQHDILQDSLTPREHLVFLAAIRGIASERVESEVKSTLSDVGLLEKANEPVGGLSGGQKRRLSVGQALIGDPHVIILDEPTAGVDPYTRRHLWSLLQERKKGKVMLLTTHFMDEADILADRKAIVSAGRLRCCGSSMFLKTRFGLGYHLTIVQGATPCVDAVDGLIANHVPDREMGRIHGNELTFILPMWSVSKFPALFADLESQLSKLGVQNFGISNTTLEEVFLHLAEVDSHADEVRPPLASVTRDVLQHQSSISGVSVARSRQPVSESNGLSEPPQVQLRPSVARSLKALLKIRLLLLKRAPATLIFTMVLPGLLLVLGLLASQLTGMAARLSVFKLGPDTYKDMTLLYHDVSGELNQSVVKGWGIPAATFNGTYTAMLDDSILAGLNVTSPSEVLAVIGGSVTHAPAIVLNAINNGRLSQLLAGTKARLELTSSPLPKAKSESNQFFTLLSALMVSTLFVLVPFNIVVELVQERELKIRNQLRANGLSFSIYFFSCLIFNGFMFFLLWLLMMVLIQAFSIDNLAAWPAYSMIGVIYLQFTVVGLLFASVVSFMFNRTGTALQVFPSLAFGGLLVDMGFKALNDLLPGNDIDLILHYFFIVTFPFYLPTSVLKYLFETYAKVKLVEQREVEYSDYWSEPVFLVPVIAQCVQIPALWLLLRWLDARKMSPADATTSCLPWKRRNRTAELEAGPVSDGARVDEDVLAEKKRVSAIMAGHNDGPAPIIVAQGLCKLFPAASKSSGVFRAVGDVSFAVGPGEVFGMLGPNGAGKTTTMRMVIAEEKPTKGQIQVATFNKESGSESFKMIQVDSSSEALSLVGYCPQFDALWKTITVEEHLRCFAQLRGVSSADCKSVIRHYIEGLQIAEHARKRSGNLSGGNRRKLSYAMSMLGRPRIVLLDEPSTGMDPQSKRFLWDTIASGFRGERSAILTTHAMEEADALCTRIGILVRGNLRCLGSTQHLKNKYGSGYVLEMKLDVGADLAERLDKVQQLVKKLFPSSELDESYGERLTYKIPQSDVVSLSTGFNELEAAKAQLGIEEYSLSQTTLEQVFLRFARAQELGE